MGSGVIWAIIVGFFFGVFVRSFFLIGYSYAGFALLLSCAALAFAFFEQARWRHYFFISLALIACACGIVRMDMATLSGDRHLTAMIGKHVELIGMVSAEPDERDSGTRVSVAVRQLINGTSTTAVHAGVLAQLPSHTGVAYGDEVRVSGTLTLPEAFDTGLGRQFRYPEYLAAQGISYQLSFANITKLGKNDGNIIKAAAINTKELYLKGTRAALSEPEGGLAGGITVGDKRSIGKELSADFQKVSLIHMIVLSGYNITVVINAVSWVLQIAPRFVRFGAGTFVAIFFILMAGGASSAMRAGIMALLAMYARATHRTFDALRALGVVCLGMVVWNPFTLAFDPSFQLSALATVGLITFTPIVEPYFSKITARLGLREIAASTIATQLVVLPFLLYQNGQLSLYALPANLLALFPVPFAMLFSLIAALAGIIFGSYAVVIAFPAYAILAYIIAIARFFAQLPFSSLSVSAFSAWWLLAAYATLFLIAWTLLRQNKNDPT